MSELNSTPNTTGEAGNISAEGVNPTPQEGRTFSQEDVNRIVTERLSREKAKADAAIAQREQELAQRELLLTAREKITERGLPIELLGALNMSTPEALESSISIIEKQFKKNDTGPARMQTSGNPVVQSPPGGDIRTAFGLK